MAAGGGRVSFLQGLDPEGLAMLQELGLDPGTQRQCQVNSVGLKRGMQLEGNGGGKGRNGEEGMTGLNQNTLYAYASVNSQIVQEEKCFCWG